MIIGYADRFSVAPGERIVFHAGGSAGPAAAALVRLWHGDERSPIGLVEEEVRSSLDGTLEPSQRPVRRGSFGLVEFREAVSVLSGHVFVHPTALETGRAQGILAQGSGEDGWAVVIEPSGDLALRVGDARLTLSGRLREDVWHAVAFTVDRRAGTAALWCHALTDRDDGLAQGAVAAGSPAGGSPLLVAALELLERTPEPRAAGTFNGKLERPALFAGRLESVDVAALAGGRLPGDLGLRALVDIDFAALSAGWALHDRCGAEGRLYNAPLRNCPSHSWRGDTLAPALDPASHAAVHFHDDDLHHANWEPSVEWRVPAGLPSGVYALRLRGDGGEDRIPFIVRPPRDRSTAAVALWLPSFTYAAYANARKALSGMAFGDYVPERTGDDALLEAHPEWGGSTYDVHADGSGVAISSLMRPVPNLRPTFRAGLVNGPRHLGADLFLVHWLRHLGVPIDVIGDEDVHAEGEALLRRYRAVLTGSHPEYVTGAQLEAVEGYTAAGGRLMYMGGNGFYWVTSVAPDQGPTVEVRRGFGATRAWDPRPGEGHHQFGGEPGGLWRHRGRPPHALVGVGFVAEGWDGRNRPYRRTPASFAPTAAWAFEGIGADEPIGDRGLVMGGAAGDEVDSADVARGTPRETMVLASSSGHGPVYRAVVENVLTTRDVTDGAEDDRLHADVTLTPRPNRGAVFAVGSISWTGSLSADAYDNPVARLSENVLRAFVSDRAPWLPD